LAPIDRSLDRPRGRRFLLLRPAIDVICARNLARASDLDLPIIDLAV